MYKTKAGTAATLALLIWIASFGQAKADVIYDNFGPGDTFSPAFLPVTNLLDIDFAVRFTVPSSGDFTLDAIRLAFLNLNPLFGTLLDVSLTQDASGLPGSIVEQYTLAVPPSFDGLLTADSTTHPSLSTGTDYWVVASAPVPLSFLGWHLNDQGATGGAFSILSSPWLSGPLPQGAVRVEGTPAASAVATPEPATLLLWGIGALAVVGYGCCRRKQ